MLYLDERLLMILGRRSPIALVPKT